MEESKYVSSVLEEAVSLIKKLKEFDLEERLTIVRAVVIAFTTMAGDVEDHTNLDDPKILKIQELATNISEHLAVLGGMNTDLSASYTDLSALILGMPDLETLPEDAREEVTNLKSMAGYIMRHKKMLVEFILWFEKQPHVTLRFYDEETEETESRILH